MDRQLNPLLLVLICFTGTCISALAQPEPFEYQLSFDSCSNTFAIENQKNNQFAISGIRMAVHSQLGTIYTDRADFPFIKARQFVSADSAGPFSMSEYRAGFNDPQFSLTVRCTTHASFAGLVLEVLLTNTSDKGLSVFSIEPVHAISKHRGTVKGKYSKALLNGAMYYDAGRIHSLDVPYVAGSFYGETKGGRFRSKELDDNPRTATSWWNIGLFDGYTEPGLSVGYLGNRESLGRIKWLKESDSTHSLIVESVFAEGTLLAPGETVSSDRVMISVGTDPYATLEMYASELGRQCGALTGSIVNGWCNWFYSHENFSMDEILRNARFAAEHLLPYGLETIQIDEGYQVAHGEWRGNSRFHGDLKGLADSLRSMRLKPGIWVAPFVISEQSWVFKHHQEWLMKSADGNLKRIGPWPGEDTDWFRSESPKRYGLDITHPEAQQWFRMLIDSLVHVYGFEMIKIDFVAWTVFSADRFHDPSATPAAVYRKALSIIHEIGGDRCHILDCGPGQVTTGHMHSMRIEYDQNYGFLPEIRKQYFQGPSSSAGALGKRYFFHNRTWTNDIDHICMDLVPLHTAQAIASLIALSGGNTMSGDRLIALDDTRLAILRKAFPSSGITARPVNLLEQDPQSVFAVACKKDSMKWTVVGFFNSDTARNAGYEYSLDRLWLNPDRHYLCFDFWKQQFAGEVTGTIQTTVQPMAVNLLALHEKTGHPQVISSSRHILQGFIELEDICYDPVSQTMNGKYNSPRGSHNSLFIYLPEGYYWDASPGKLFRDYGSYSVKYSDRNILRVDFDCRRNATIEWQIRFVKI